jgi:hypothetical protein
MKKMKAPILLVSVLSGFLLFGCGKTDPGASPSTKNCADEGHERNTFFPGITAANFTKCLTPMVVGDITYYSSYSIGKDTAVLLMTTNVRDHVCSYGDLLISPRLFLKTAIPGLKTYFNVTSPNGNQLIEVVTPKNNGTEYMVDEIYTFKKQSPDPTSYITQTAIIFPSQGNWSADSSTFFSHLESMDFASVYYSTE